MNEQAARDVYTNHRNGISASIGEFGLSDCRVKGRAERIVADFAHPSFDGVQPV
jgi:hypothetical protein